MADSTQYSLIGEARITDPKARLLEELDNAFSYCKKHQTSGAILNIAIDDLAMLMSCYSNAVIDKMLVSLKKAVHDLLPKNAALLHTEYDQLSIILSDTGDAKTEALADKLYHLSKRFGSQHFTDEAVFITISIGAAHFPTDLTADSRQAIEHAYIALHNAKKRLGHYYSTYRMVKADADGIKKKIQAANYLQKAIHEDKLRLAFQPIINSSDGSTFCYECLLRSIEEDGEIKSVGASIPVAEELDFIDEIDHLVLRKVVDELKQDPNVRLGFNISNQAIDSPHWFKNAAKLLNDPDIASRVIVEITETGVQQDLDRTSYFVASLQGLGCKVALDDFGAGYTSFKQLKALPVDIVKIDGSFVQDILDNYDSKLFVKTLLDFTNSFGLQTIAEYVETGEIAKSLMDLKVTYLQGHYFSAALNHRPWLKE